MVWDGGAPAPPSQGAREWKETQVNRRAWHTKQERLPALSRKGASAGFIVRFFFFPLTHYPLPPFESLTVKIQENLMEAEAKNVSLEPGAIWKKHTFSLRLRAA